MYNKWLQAAGHALSFDRIDDTALDVSDEPYCAHLIMLFTQLSTLAMLKLHSGKANDDDWLALGSDSCHFTNGVKKRKGTRLPLPRFARGSKGTAASTSGIPNTLRRQNTTTGIGSKSGAVAFNALHATMSAPVHRPSQDQGSRPNHRPSTCAVLNAYATRVAAGMNAADGEEESFGTNKVQKTRFRRRSMSIVHADEDAMLFTQHELIALRLSACPVHMTEHRIHRTLTSRCRARGWKAPAPVFNRVFTELAEAMAEYDSALKLKQVPVPFGFVQFNALLLLCFIVLEPIAIACFSSTLSMSVITSVVSVGGFVSMWLVANEMESPFGTEANSLDLRNYHNEFVMRLADLFKFTAADTWIVGNGAWVPPPAEGTPFNEGTEEASVDLTQAIESAVSEWRRSSAIHLGAEFVEDLSRVPTLPVQPSASPGNGITQGPVIDQPMAGSDRRDSFFKEYIAEEQKQRAASYDNSDRPPSLVQNGERSRTAAVDESDANHREPPGSIPPRQRRPRVKGANGMDSTPGEIRLPRKRRHRTAASKPRGADGADILVQETTNPTSSVPGPDGVASATISLQA